MGKLLLLTLDEQEEKIIDKIISALSNYIQLEDIQVTPVSVLSFPGLEIRQSQHRGMMIERLSFPGIFFCLKMFFRGIFAPCSRVCIVRDLLIENIFIMFHFLHHIFINFFCFFQLFSRPFLLP